MRVLWLACLFSLIEGTLFAQNENLSRGQVAKALMQQSMQNYPGNCPCPYNTDRAGRKCGARSAYLRGGGYRPLCFETDVTKEMIEHYQAQREHDN